MQEHCDTHLQGDPVTSVDFTLSSGDEHIMDDVDRLRRRLQLYILLGIL